MILDSFWLEWYHTHYPSFSFFLNFFLSSAAFEIEPTHLILFIYSFFLPFLISYFLPTEFWLVITWPFVFHFIQSLVLQSIHILLDFYPYITRFLILFWTIYLKYIEISLSCLTIYPHITRFLIMSVYISSSCHAASTDIPDPLSPLLPIIHRFWQVFRATSRILT